MSKNIGKRAFLIMLAAAVIVTFMPVLALSQNSFAASKPGKVKWSTVTTTYNSVTLKWKKVKKAKGYVLYKKVGKKYKKLATTSKRSYTDTKGIAASTKYYYYAKAYKKSGKKKIYGKKSSVKSAKTVSDVVKRWNIGLNSSSRYFKDGKSTSSVVATLYANGNLAITGTGKVAYMYHDLDCDTPWYANGYASKIKSSTIQSTVKPDSIACWYYDCVNLVSAPAIPTGVTDAGNAFYNCKSLKNAPVLPSGITSLYGTFSGCTKLATAPAIPTGVTNMPNAFSDCTALATAPAIPDSVTNMSGTFSGCTALTKAPDIPASVTDILQTFFGCTKLATAPAIPASANVTDMSRTFCGCTALTTAPDIPTSVTNMSYTFSECTALITAPTIPPNVTDMSGTFSGCTKLTTAPNIPGNVEKMDYTFYKCRSLRGYMRINVSSEKTSYVCCFTNAATSGNSLTVNYQL